MQMLDTKNTDGQKSEDQQQLSVSNRAAHDEQYPFLSEFSELVAKLSIEELLELTTHQQKQFAKALWEACNYGGSSIKCEKRLKEIYGKPVYFDSLRDVIDVSSFNARTTRYHKTYNSS